MIDLHYWTTPNGHKITMFLEETGLAYRIIPVNINTGAQFDPKFLALSPNNRIPAIVDYDPKGGGAPLSVFESGAILLYLAEKTGQLLPSDLRERYEVIQWLFWQMAGLGPMAGQNHHFTRYAPEPIPYAIERYVKETNRLYGVLNKRLTDHRAYEKAKSVNPAFGSPAPLTEETRRVLFGQTAR
ncbi:MAG: thiol:disulfide oxidoreductase [Gammaproteobacteria bacterium]|nr:MAG: thiol:disulfide oxidoreductase [Gammaproteobacteria bacterium]